MDADLPVVLNKVLALDSSTDRLSIALGSGGFAETPWRYDGVGGAQASSTLIPAIQELLAQAGWRLDELDAIAFGCGPGAFTGLRTACAVVQGLAVAARPGGIPVLPVHTLLAVAEEARVLWANQEGAAMPERIMAVLDARMDEMYVAEVALQAGDSGTARLRLLDAAWLSAPEALHPAARLSGQHGRALPLLAGNAMPVYGSRLPSFWQDCPQVLAWPTAAAILRLTPDLWRQGLAVEAAAAQPVYVRDKVAQTTAERERARAEKLLALQTTEGGTTP